MDPHLVAPIASASPVTVFQEIDDLSSIPDFSFTQNSDRCPSVLKVEEIKPSGKTLEELADPSEKHALLISKLCKDLRMV
jgi:hypothetical protein